MDTDKNFSSIEIPLVRKLYDLYGHAHKSISSFPKHERYSLGERIETNILEAMELTLFGNAQPKNFRDTYLLKANAKVEILKILFRLALDNAFIHETHSTFATKSISRKPVKCSAGGSSICSQTP